MSINIEEIQDSISKLLEINRKIILEVQIGELQEMQEKLEFLVNIKSLLLKLKRPPLSDSLDLSTPEGEVSSDGNPFTAAAERERVDMILRNNPFADRDNKTATESQAIIDTCDAIGATIAGVTESGFSNALKRSIALDALSPSSAVSTVVSIPPEDPANASPISSKLEALAVERKHAVEVESTLKESDSTPSMQELFFSKMLMKSINKDRKDNNAPPLVTASASTASTAESTGNPEDAEIPDEIREAYENRPETPRTEYRTISLSTSSPRG